MLFLTGKTSANHSVFLAVAGPYPTNPASVFGHVFLAITPNDSISFLNWIAINFGANTENSRLLDYYIKGIGGGFDAYYNVLPVHEKIREYAGTESRDIRLFPLKISNEEYEKLTNYLKDQIKKTHPYKFFTYNCAHGIYTLLYSSLDSLPPAQKIMSPQDLIIILQNENRLNYSYLFPSLKERILNSQNKETTQLEFLEWQNMQRNVKKDTLREKKLKRLRYSVAKNKEENRNLLKPEKSSIKPHNFSRLDIGTQFIESKANAFIRFRPLLHDPSDNSSYYSAYSTLELLSLGLNINDKGINFREFDLIHIRSAPAFDFLFHSLSWDIFAGYKNKRIELNFGLGASFYINKKRKIVLEFLPLNSVKCRNNFSCTDFIGIETQLNKHSTGKFRYGANFEYLRNFPDFENKHIQFKTWISYDINRSFNLYAENIFGIGIQKTIGLYMRFYI
ncbi:MAG: DUF4105 domain-containing protein [Fibrobacter sp.]|jgi:hypothetical protein|nr:DUF4105 domain-containing protein [Fibrobacter sp.]